jgi:phytoene dehydrogenase-like protein
VTLFALAPGAVADILGDRLPSRVARAYRRFRHGPGVFKVDFAVERAAPWTNPDAHREGTVHLGGVFAEIAATERQIHAGQFPERPFVLVGQQYLADPQRSTGNVHPLWTYAHVPHGFVGASLFFALVPNWWGVTTGVVLLAATLSSADGHAEQAGPPRTASRSPPGRC